MFKIFTLVFGCPSNIADYEIALGLLKGAGFEIAKSQEEADLNIIFTCVVKEQTFQKMIFKIKELTKIKKPLIVAGCMAKSDSKLIERINPNASIITPDNIEKIVDAVNIAMKGKKVLFIEDSNKPKLNLPRCRKNPFIGIVQISKGCLSNCSYCYEPYRGKFFSYPLSEIVEEVKSAIESGCKEVWITSLDNGCYGFDIGLDLADLLNEVCKINEKFFVRVGMMNPLHIKKFLNKLIEAYQNEKIFKFVHIPVQSGSNKILKLMRRGYKARDFIQIVKKFRKKIPLITISTDIIVGFPYESERDFKSTIQLIEKTKPDMVNISKFGARFGTEAAKMEQLNRKVVNERSSFLTNLVRKISLENNEKWVGWEGEIFVDEIGKNNSLVGRNFAYKPVVIKANNLLGKFVNVKIFDVSSSCLFGKIK
jgi:MiaB-like tRNA modifying enzyme